MVTKRALQVIRRSGLALLLVAVGGVSILPRNVLAGGPLRLYVKWNASGANNGSSWANAYTSVQAALDAAAGGGYQIWVAAGTYRPFRGLPLVSDTFLLHNNVGVYGGFAGTETLLSQRNWQTNVTILNGYLFVFNTPHHAYHVITGSGTDATALLDGFTVTGGAASGTGTDTLGGGILVASGSPTISNVIITGNSAAVGGGMYNDGSSPMLTNVTFSGNSAISFGGGMGNYNGSNPTLTNVTFSGNSTQSGGGMTNRSSSPTLNGVIFSGNSATNKGGGIYNSTGSSPVLTSATFTGNDAPAGGGMYNNASNPTLTNAVFSGNSATNTGGGVHNFNSNPMLTNVTFSGNSATNTGGGLHNDGSSPTIVNTIVWGNTAPSGAQILNVNSSSPIVTYSDIEGGYTGTGNINVNPKFIRNPNPGVDDYGDLHLQPDSSAIDAGSDAAVPGGITTDRDGDPRIMGIKVDMGAFESFPLRILLPLIRK